MARRNNKQEEYIDDSRLVISVKEARKILGKKSEAMKDEEVEALVVSLQFDAEAALQDKGS